MSAQGDVVRGTADLPAGQPSAGRAAEEQAAVDPGDTPAARGYPGGPQPAGPSPAEQSIAHVGAPGQPPGGPPGQAGGRSRLRLRAKAASTRARTAGAAAATGKTPSVGKAGSPASGNAGSRGRAGRAQASVWQQAWNVWNEAGIAWGRPQQAPAPRRPEHEHTEPIPAIRDALPAASAAAGPAAAGPAAPRATADGLAAAGGAMPPGASEKADAVKAEAANAAAAIPATADGRTGAAGAPGPRQVATGRSRRRLVVTVGTAVAVLIAAGGAYLWHSAVASAPSLGSAAGLPTARLADADFGARLPAARAGAAPVLAGLAGSGADVVAFGSEPRLPAAAPFFLFSADGGRTWRTAALTGHGAVPDGVTPEMAAGGPGRWLALGPNAAWVSANGLSWTAVRGVAPLASGERVLSLTWTGSAFVAVGEQANATGTAEAPIMWTSADGLTWQRRAGQALRLPANGRVGALRWAVSSGNALLVEGDVVRPGARRHGGRKAAAVSGLPGAWRTTDDGVRWTPVAVPARHGVAPLPGGIAATGRYFVAVRPGRGARGRPDTVAYVSADGTRWRFAGKVTGGALRLGAVAGDGEGVIVTGSVGAHQVGFVSVDGRHWARVLNLGAASARLSGVAVVPGGAVIAAGSTSAPGRAAASTGSPFLLLAGARTERVGQRALAAAAHPLVDVRDLAAGGGREVAVGAADGVPAIWLADADGHWSHRDPGAAAAGVTALTSVAHADAGWLAIGGEQAPSGAAGPAGVAPSAAPSAVLISRDGRAWLAAPGAGPLTAPGVSLARTAAGRLGYVVVGQQVSHGHTVAAAWWSSSLTSWAPAAGWPGGEGGQPSRALAVAAGKAGFVAAGAIGAAPAVWVSPDGRRWTAVTLPLPAGSGQAVLTQVAVDRQRVVAVGMTTPRDGPRPAPFAAVSLDGGRTWRESPLPTSRAPAAVTAVTATPGGFVAAGVRGVFGRQRTVFWWSAPGRGWQVVLVGQPGTSQVTALRTVGSTVTGVGYQDAPGAEHPVLWLAPAR